MTLCNGGWLITVKQFQITAGKLINQPVDSRFYPVSIKVILGQFAKICQWQKDFIHRAPLTRKWPLNYHLVLLIINSETREPNLLTMRTQWMSYMCSLNNNEQIENWARTPRLGKQIV